MGFIRRLGDQLMLLGIPGVFLLSLLDSAAVPMVGGPDAAVLLLAWKRPAALVWIALAATFGSLLGCLLLYQAGAAGRRIVAARRDGKQSWALRNLDRHAAWALAAATLAPPPFPAKPAILGAGVMRLGLGRFVAGVLAGRILRYTAVAWAGARFGDQGMKILSENYPGAALAAIAAAALIFLISRIARRPHPERQVAAAAGNPADDKP